MEVTASKSFKKKGTILLILLGTLLSILGINGLVGGLLMLLEPSGSLLGMGTEWLEGSPFKSFRLPGLLLMVFLGFLPLLSLAGISFRFHWSLVERLNLYSGRHWAWAFCIYSSLSTFIWIAVQQLFTGFFWLQPVILILAILILICTLSPAIIQRLTN